MANSKLKQVNAVVKEKNEGWPCVQSTWGASDSCSGQHVTGFSQLGIPHLQLMCDQSSRMAGVWGCGAGKMLGCGPEGDYCTGKCPKNVSFSKILMPKSIILSHSQEWMWDLILWDKKGLGRGEWNISILALLILQTYPVGFSLSFCCQCPAMCWGRAEPSLPLHLFSG